MQIDLTQGKIGKKLLLFALPLMAGNALQQLYTVADTLIVGRCIGQEALAAVGSSYTLMTFLTSILLGLCMGSGAYFSMAYGRRDMASLRCGMVQSFVLIGAIAVLLNVLVLVLIDPIMRLLQVPADVWGMMHDYLSWVFWGITATFVYNYFANVLRAIGNSVVPLAFLAVSALLNIALDLWFVVTFDMGAAGAAIATVIAQFVSAIGITVYFFLKFGEYRPRREDMRFDRGIVRQIANLSGLTCVQQSVMNFGILAVQGLVNSFGSTIMAAFAAAVKIDSFAYMPVQDFGNAFSTFVAQNYGARQGERIRRGMKTALCWSISFCLIVSLLVCVFAAPLMSIFVEPSKTAIVEAGVTYLRIEASCYFGIGVLFLLYGFYRAVGRAGMSVVLTVISLGTRVALAYLLSGIPFFGVRGIWLAVPIGWILADAAGLGVYAAKKKTMLQI